MSLITRRLLPIRNICRSTCAVDLKTKTAARGIFSPRHCSRPSLRDLGVTTTGPLFVHITPSSFPRRNHSQKGMAEKLNAVVDVEIDKGDFKYILIKVSTKDDKASKYIVRGDKSKPYHADIFDDVSPKIMQAGLQCDCVGGGRILHEPGEKSIRIYGESVGYGRADHNISCEILKKHFPEYSVTVE